jgi:hypothetical protein
MSEHNWANESQDTTAPIKRRLSDAPRLDRPRRLDPEFRADLIEFARSRIQMVWDDAGEVDATTLASNVVAAQEWLWLSLHFPVVPEGEQQ